MKYSAWYGILVGFLMLAQWALSIVSGGVPEFQTASWAIGFHLAAEFSTTLLLIVGGIASLRATTGGKQILLVGLGMVIYSEIVSPGYFAQKSQWAVVSSPLGITPTPNIMPGLNPSPTPPDSTLPLTCQVTDLSIYINEMNGYCFTYPSRLISDDSGVHGPALDDSLEPPYASFGVAVTPATDRSLREQAEVFLKEVSAIDPATFTWTQVPVGGEAGLMVEPVPAYGSWRYVFVLHNGSLFRLSYWDVASEIVKTDPDELTQTTLGSFAFTK